MKIRYMYIRDSRRNPIGVLAIVRENSSLKYQYSMTHPVDGFNKNIGKVTALEALVTNPKVVITTDCDMSGHAVSREVLNQLATHTANIPTRLVKFARAWLCNQARHNKDNVCVTS